jgi:hypothetical protein
MNSLLTTQLAHRFSNPMYRFLLLLFAAHCLLGCADKPPPKPQASDWARRNLEGVSIEAPYELTTNGKPLPGWVNIASYMPANTPHALEIRVDVLQQPAGEEAPTLDQFAQNVFTVIDDQSSTPKKLSLIPVKVGNLDGLQNKSQSKEKVFIDSLVFKKGMYYWLIEVFYIDESLSGDAKRVIDSVKIE